MDFQDIQKQINSNYFVNLLIGDPNLTESISLITKQHFKAPYSKKGVVLIPKAYLGIGVEYPQYHLDVSETGRLDSLIVNNWIKAGLSYETTSDVVYFNSTTKQLSYGPAPTISIPTLQTVTTAGSTTTNSISVGGLTVDTDTLVVDGVNNVVSIGANAVSDQKLYVKISNSGATSIRFDGAVGGHISYSYASYIGAYYGAGWRASANAVLISHQNNRLLLGNGISGYGLTLFGNDVIIGGHTPSAKLHVLNSSSSKVGAIIQAAAGQTANTFEIKDSAGNIELSHLIGNGLFVQNYSSGSTVFNGNARGSGTVAFELQCLSSRRFRVLANATSTTFESSNQSGGFIFNKAITPASLADASAQNNSIYYSTDAGKLVYKDSAGTSNNLYDDGLIDINTQTGTSYTLALSDSGGLVEMNNASANTLTIPPNSSVAFPIGTQIVVEQYGAGQTTFAAGAGVTIRSKSGNLKIAAQYGGATLIQRATDEWVLMGDLTA